MVEGHQHPSLFINDPAFLASPTPGLKQAFQRTAKVGTRRWDWRAAGFVLLDEVLGVASEPLLNSFEDWKGNSAALLAIASGSECALLYLGSSPYHFIICLMT